MLVFFYYLDIFFQKFEITYLKKLKYYNQLLLIYKSVLNKSQIEKIIIELNNCLGNIFSLALA